MPQLTQGLGFDLANALAGDGERPANLLQRMLRAILQTKAHLHDLFLAQGQGAQHLRGLFLQVHVMMASTGETIARSSIKSLRWESPSSPTGVSSEIGTCMLLNTLVDDHFLSP